MPEPRWILETLDEATPRTHVIEPDGITLGRSPECAVTLSAEEFPGVSSFHARVSLHEGRVVLDDLNSSNGTWIGDERVTRRVLEPGAVFELGRSGPRFALLKEGTDARRTVILSRGPKRRRPLGNETIEMLKQELGIEGGVDEMLRRRSRVLHLRTRRARWAWTLVASLAVVALGFGIWFVSRRTDTITSDLERRLQERLEDTREDLTAFLGGFHEERDRIAHDWESFAREKALLEQRRADLEKRIEELGRAGEGQREELARMAVRLEDTSRDLRRFDPVNVEQEKLRRVGRVERAVVLIEVSARYVDPISGKALHVDRSSGTLRPNFDERGEEFRNESSGSGFVVDEDGWILTNAHVVLEKGDDTSQELGRSLGLRPEVTLTVTFSGTSDRLPAELVSFRSAGAEDLALLRIEPFPAMPHLGGLDLDLPVPERGSDVFLIGFPLGKKALQPGTRVIASTFRGILSRRVDPYLQVDAAVHPGASGGPLIDGRGRLIGVVVGRQKVDQERATSTIGYIIPLEAIKKLWPPPPR